MLSLTLTCRETVRCGSAPPAKNIVKVSAAIVDIVLPLILCVIAGLCFTGTVQSALLITTGAIAIIQMAIIEGIVRSKKGIFNETPPTVIYSS